MVSSVLASVVSSGGASAIFLGILFKLISYIKYLDIEYSLKLEAILRSWNSQLIFVRILPDIPHSIREELASKNIPNIFTYREVAPTFLENFWKVFLALSFLTLTYALLSF